jgi:hypothetical protein
VEGEPEVAMAFAHDALGSPQIGEDSRLSAAISAWRQNRSAWPLLAVSNPPSERNGLAGGLHTIRAPLPGSHLQNLPVKQPLFAHAVMIKDGNPE